MLSALEVNAYGFQNTFFDEFDTYIESKEQVFEKATIKQPKKDKETSLPLFSVANTHFINPTFLVQVKNYSSLYSQLHKCKLTILHSVWRI